MSLELAPQFAAAQRRPAEPAVLLLVVWLAAAATLLVRGFAVLPEGVSTDDAMRLVQVRDWLAGQDWFDLTQHRLSPPTGVAMHWSRLVDLPLAALILAGENLFGRAGAERLVLAAWPLLLFLAALAGAGALARRLAGRRAAALAILLTTLAAPLLGHFRPGAIDHHNIQIVLLLWTVALLARTPLTPRVAAFAGLAAALSVAIGLEMLPAIAVIGVTVAGAWLWRGRAAAAAAAAFGTAFAVGLALLFVATVPPAHYSFKACDALSIVHVTAAGLGGLGLTALATTVRGPFAHRLAAAAGLVAVIAATLALAFPACLGDPYGAIDPKLTALWLEHVAEAQPIAAVAQNLPAELLPLYGFPVAALLLALLALRQATAPWPWLATAAPLAALIAVSLWEMRGAAAADALAAPLMAAALVQRFRDHPAGPLGLPRPAMAAALLLNYGTLAVTGEAVARVVERLTHPRPLIVMDGPATCRRPADFVALGQLPPGLVVAQIDSGPYVLMTSRHSVIAAPYHRNTSGNGAAVAIWLAPPAEAGARLAATGADYLAFCPGAPEAITFARTAPDGLAARLEAGEVPDYLQPVPAGETPLAVFRVRR
jgi:hypothetical protein